MSDLTQARADLKAARQRLRELKEARLADAIHSQADRIERQPAGRRILESSSVGPLGPTTLDWISAYSLILDRLRGEPYSYNITSPYDRKWGRNFPIYQSESELSLLRAPSRVLVQTNTYAQALVGGLRSYIIGEGFTYRAVARKKASPPPALLDAVQSVMDRFLRRNQWHGSESWAELDQLPLRPIEDETFERSLRDGEATILHTWDDDEETVIARFVEPEFITQPPGGRWEEWSFGWRTPANDEQRKLAAWISFTGNTVEGDEYSVDRLSYLPRNTDRILKRGVPDFAFDAGDALQTSQRLRRALAIGGAVKASIVGVRQHKAQTQTQTTAFRDALTDFQQTDLPTGQTVNVRHMQPGEWEDIDENLEYKDGPSTKSEGALVEVLQACLRGAVVRWNGFEWLVSADASSNSYANALAAESPAVKRVQCEQKQYKAFFARSITIAVKNAADRGLIRAEGRTWEWLEIRQVVDVQIESPSPEVRNKKEETDQNVALKDAGIKSVQTICQEQNLDYEREMANIEAHKQRFPDQDPNQQQIGQEGQAFESQDASGHEHKGSGPGGGQFTSSGGGATKKSKSKVDRKPVEKFLLGTGFEQSDLDEMDDKELLANYRARGGESAQKEQPPKETVPANLPSAIENTAVAARALGLRVAVDSSAPIDRQLFALGGVDSQVLDPVYDQLKAHGHHSNIGSANEVFRSLDNSFRGMKQESESMLGGRSPDKIKATFNLHREKLRSLSRALRQMGMTSEANLYDTGLGVVDSAEDYALRHFAKH